MDWPFSCFLHSDNVMFVCRYRNFERLHRHLKDIPNYSLHLPPKRFLSSSIDDYFVHQRCILLDKYLQVWLLFRFVVAQLVNDFQHTFISTLILPGSSIDCKCCRATWSVGFFECFFKSMVVILLFKSLLFVKMGFFFFYHLSFLFLLKLILFSFWFEELLIWKIHICDEDIGRYVIT